MIDRVLWSAAFILVGAAGMPAAGPAAAAELPPNLQCAGTEPFWALNIEGDEARFETPDRQGELATKLAVETRLTAENRFGLWALRLRSSEQRSEQTIAVIREVSCSDGMSEIEYPFAVALLHEEGGQSLLDGCCE